MKLRYNLVGTGCHGACWRTLRASRRRGSSLTLGEKMRVRLQIATSPDVSSVLELRAAVAKRLTADYGEGPWSRSSTEKGVLFDMRNSKLYVASDGKRVIASLRLTTKKPWAIDRSYFTTSQRPVYLLSMAVLPELQHQGIGRLCLESVREICERWPADAIRLDAYDARAGAGSFYAKCGFKDVGRAAYRGVPLAYYELLLTPDHHSRETPNKALEPTRPLVTSRAAARLAPSGRVAHL